MVKTKVKAELFGAGLFKYMEGLNMEKLLTGISEPDKTNVRLETKILSVFAVDYGTNQVLGNTPEKKAVLDIFRAFLWNESEKFFGCAGPVIFPKIKDRVFEYRKALQMPNNVHPFFYIGQRFSQFCSGKNDPFLAYEGTTWFQGILQFLPLREYLEDYEIEI